MTSSTKPEVHHYCFSTRERPSQGHRQHAQKFGTISRVIFELF